LFDSAAPESVFFQAEVYHDWKASTFLDAHFHWAPTTANTGSVAFKLAWMVQQISGTFAFSAGDTLSARQAGSGTAFNHQFCDLGYVSMAGITGISAIISGVLVRDANLNSDTYTGDAALLDIGFHYRKNAFGSRWEEQK
jgi:hypothetical protein